MENRTWKSVKSTIMPICIISIICILLICSKILLLEVFGTIGLIFIIIAVGCVLYYDLSPKEQRKQREIDESIKRDRLERINSIRDKKAKLDLEIESYSTKYGKLTRKILYTSNYDGLFVVQCNNLKVFDSYDEEGQKQDFISYDEFDYWFLRPFLVYEETSIIIIDQDILRFEEILNYSVTDNSKTIYSEQVAKTTTDTGSLIGRTVIGSLALGSVGATIGGATADRITTISPQESHQEHDYTINITVNNLACPMVTVKLGNDTNNVVNQMVSILSIIIKRNSRN